VKFIRFQLLVLGILTCASLTQAQVWVKQSTTAQTSPHARAAAAITYSPVLQGVLLFGGEDGNTSYRDTWLWTDHWTKLSPATSPLGRSGANMVYDATNGDIVLFGGRNNARRADFNDTWTFDGTNWTRQFPANSPPPRSLDQPAMTFDAAHGNVIFFGGSSLAGGYFGDTWTWTAPTGLSNFRQTVLRLAERLSRTTRLLPASSCLAETSSNKPSSTKLGRGTASTGLSFSPLPLPVSAV
jgi:hypothetical protein